MHFTKLSAHHCAIKLSSKGRWLVITLDGRKEEKLTKNKILVRKKAGRQSSSHVIGELEIFLFIFKLKATINNFIRKNDFVQMLIINLWFMAKKNYLFELGFRIYSNTFLTWF